MSHMPPLQYGRDLMALDQEQAKALQYRGYPSSLTLLGFVERDALPRHHHMSVSGRVRGPPWGWLCMQEPLLRHRLALLALKSG